MKQIKRVPGLIAIIAFALFSTTAAADEYEEAKKSARDLAKNIASAEPDEFHRYFEEKTAGRMALRILGHAVPGLIKRLENKDDHDLDLEKIKKKLQNVRDEYEFPENMRDIKPEELKPFEDAGRDLLKRGIEMIKPLTDALGKNWNPYRNIDDEGELELVVYHPKKVRMNSPVYAMKTGGEWRAFIRRSRLVALQENDLPENPILEENGEIKYPIFANRSVSEEEYDHLLNEFTIDDHLDGPETTHGPIAVRLADTEFKFDQLTPKLEILLIPLPNLNLKGELHSSVTYHQRYPYYDYTPGTIQLDKIADSDGNNLLDGPPAKSNMRGGKRDFGDVIRPVVPEDISARLKEGVTHEDLAGATAKGSVNLNLPVNFQVVTLQGGEDKEEFELDQEKVHLVIKRHGEKNDLKFRRDFHKGEELIPIIRPLNKEGRVIETTDQKVERPVGEDDIYTFTLDEEPDAFEVLVAERFIDRSFSFEHPIKLKSASFTADQVNESVSFPGGDLTVTKMSYSEEDDRTTVTIEADNLDPITQVVAFRDEASVDRRRMSKSKKIEVTFAGKIDSVKVWFKNYK